MPYFCLIYTFFKSDYNNINQSILFSIKMEINIDDLDMNSNIFGNSTFSFDDADPVR
jgi:hypothetical protein